MEYNLNTVALKNNSVVKRDALITNELNDSYVAAINTDLMQVGYILSNDASEYLSKLSISDLVVFHTDTIAFLKAMMGIAVNGEKRITLWPNFPHDVKNASHLQLMHVQVRHYVSNGKFLPESEFQYELYPEYEKCFSHKTYTVLNLITLEEFKNIFTRLVSVNNSLTIEDTKVVNFFVKSGIELVFPNTIPFKENLCLLAGMGLPVPVKSTTDVLRIAVYLSGGDITLTKNVKFEKFSNADRRMLMSLLNSTNCDVREMKLKREKWLRLGEILHPGSYKNKYSRAAAAFYMLRNSNVKSWYSEVNHAFEVSFENGLNKLAERPGEFIRRLDYLVRTGNLLSVVKTIKTLNGVSNKVVLEAIQHFERRSNPVTGRKIQTVGSRRATVLPDLPALSNTTINLVKSGLFGLFEKNISTLPKIGKVWIDEKLKKISMPKNMRSLNPSLKPFIVGSRLKMCSDDAKVIRTYIHWYDKNGTLDIDSSAYFFYENSKNFDLVSWNSTLLNKYAAHSGDIRHVVGNCAEYIDIDIDKALAYGVRYAVVTANDFNNNGFVNIPECVFGFQEIGYLENSKFDASNISNSIKLQSDATATCIAILDLKTREYIFIDLDLHGIMASSLKVPIYDILLEYTQEIKFSVYDLCMFHALNRNATMVKSAEEADVAFKYEDFCNDYIKILELI